MKLKNPWMAAVLALAALTFNSGRADVLIDNFQNFNPNALYPSWGTPASTITQHAASWEVSAIGYGSLWKYEGDINASGASGVRLTLDISGDPGFIAGPIVDLVDNTGKWAVFHWYGRNTAGSYVLTADFNNLSSPDVIPAGFNFADIQHIHLECDPGSAATIMYDLNFKDLSLIVVPEPGSLTLLGLGAIGFALARRRGR